jgi:pimeloyl-ACP methyl ester carboxylesterase
MSKTGMGSGEAFAEVGALTICYETFGDRNDPPLLLVAGLGAQMILFEDDFCAALAARGFWVIRFDNRDIGRSSRIDWTPPTDNSGEVAAPYRLKDMAADAIGLMDALGVASGHVVGASMGGMIAQEMAIGWPDRVRTLTSIMSNTGEPGFPRPSEQAVQVFTAPPPTTAEDYVEANVRAWLIFRGAGFPEDEQRDRPRAVRAVQRGGFDPRGGQRQFLAVMTSGSRKAALAKVTAPTLVIHGADDPLVSLDAGKDSAASIPGAKLVLFERMGHAMPIETWPRIIDEIVALAK